MMRRTLVMAMAFCLTISLLANDARATETGQTQFPGAYDANTNAGVDEYLTTIMDGYVVGINGPTWDQWITTGNFVQPVPGVEMPPYNATITAVFFLAVVSSQYYRNFSLSYGFDTVWGYTWYHEHWFEITAIAFPYYWMNVYWNITSYESWTYAMVVDSGLAIRLFSDDHGTIPLYIDYIGIQYNWSWTEEEEEENATALGPLSISGVFGVIGVVGMICTAPVSIWLYRRDGGSKILAGLVALGTFIVCATFFLASISV
jgi:hypothetical protein